MLAIDSLPALFSLVLDLEAKTQQVQSAQVQVTEPHLMFDLTLNRVTPRHLHRLWRR